MKKYVAIVLAFILGAGVSTMLLFHQIQNRYDMGFNAGHSSGVFKVIHFLDENIENDSSKEIIDLGKHINYKYKRISIIEIDGVKTVTIR